MASLIEYTLCSGTIPLCPCPQGSFPVSLEYVGENAKTENQTLCWQRDRDTYRKSNRQADTHREKRKRQTERTRQKERDRDRDRETERQCERVAPNSI